MSSVNNVEPNLVGWIFQVEEISAGVYRVRGVDEMGRNVEEIGTDPDTLLEQCKKSATQLAEQEKS
ncbi:MAG TPA: hypothetical protein VI298_01500 [Geobacteraceae bacterium]